MKLIKIMATVVLGVIVLFFIVMYSTTYGVYKSVEYAFMHDRNFNDYISKHMTEEVYDSIHGDLFAKDDIKSRKLSLRRTFVIHDFNKGVIWMRYTYTEVSKSGQTSGSWNIPIKLIIQKVNGCWKIIKKYEDA
jgi:hypothetical protein